MTRVLVACVRGNVAERDRGRHCLCVDCKRAGAQKRRDWQRQHPEKVKAYGAKWKAANREQRTAIVRSWRERNPDKVAVMSAKAGRKWAASNKGKRNATVKARQHAKRQSMPPWVDRAAFLPIYEEAARLTRETGIPHEVDHIVPIQHPLVCGLHVPANLRVIPRSANRAKRNTFEVGPCTF